MLLQVSNVSKRFGDREVFGDISFSAEAGHKIALVGRNGAGKSTLLKIIAGLEKPDSGEVVFAKDRTVGYLPQEAPDESTSLFNYIQSSPKGPFPEHIIYTVFDGFGVSKNAATKSFASVSGGQRTKALLTRLLLENPDVVLLDEPTNNLDIPSLVWLEEYLQRLGSTRIIVSHDPYFLKKTTDRLLEIDSETGKINTSKGSYIDYLERKEKDFATAMRKYKEALRERERLMKAYRESTQQSKMLSEREEDENDNIEKTGAHARRERAGRKVNRQTKQMKRRAQNMEMPDKPIEVEEMIIQIHALPAEASGEIKIDDAVIGYSKGMKIQPFSSVIPFGTRVCVLGDNGSGKSTLLSALTGKRKPITGSIVIGEDIVFGDLMQHHDQLRVKDTVRVFFEDETGTRGERAYNTLQKYGVEPMYADRPAHLLSPGARARALFAVFEQNKVNALVLDEPTNHLDIEATTALVEMLKTYEGTVILTTHNRWFLEKVAVDSFFRIQDSKIVKVDDFLTFVKSAEKDASRIIQRLRRI